jgi:crotonobetainyl-CoA:carnitine CoA-transferase CaiB-like acyl-CoA transferase
VTSGKTAAAAQNPSPEEPDPASFPLAGILVADLTTDYPGHLCGRLLADAGAQVVRVADAETGLGWDTFLERGMPAADADLRSLVRRAHVLLRTRAEDGVAAGERRSDLIEIQLPPWGAGPYEGWQAGEVVLSALCGLTDCTPGYPDWQEGPIQPPVESSARLAEFGAAVTCALATVSLLLQRMRGAASPSIVEVSQFEAITALMIFDWGAAAYGGEAPGRRRNGRLLEPNCFVQCQDGYAVLVATNDKQWQRLAQAMGYPDWAADERFATIMGRAEHKDDLHRLIETWAVDNSARQLAIAAQEAGVPCASVLSLADAITSEQVTALGSFEPADGGVLPGDPVVRNGRRRRRYTPRPAEGDPAWFPPPPGAAAGPPLSGIRVLDLSQLIAGPVAGQYLVSLGAEVLIVESRQHPTPRMYGPFAGEPMYDGSANFNHANRDKRSVELNLKSADGQRILSQLVRHSDVVLENFSRRAATELGITYDRMRAEKPDIVLASLSAFGRQGPWGGYTANHAGVAAFSGLASVTLGPEGEPHLAGGVMPDVLTGAYMALAIVETLAARALTGQGAHIEVNMLEVILNAMGGIFAVAGRGGAAIEAPAAFYEIAEEGSFVAVAKPHNRAEVKALIRGLPVQAAAARLQAAGYRASPVQNLLAVLTDPHLVARDFVRTLDHPVAGRQPLPGVPWRYDGVRPALGVAPLLGSDTQQVLSELLHLSPQEIEDLRVRGALQ